VNALRRPTDLQSRLAGWAVAIGIAVALIGALFGLVFGVVFGPLRGPESWLICSCVILSSILLVLLVRSPERATSLVSSLAGLYFMTYLCACISLALVDRGNLLRCLPYMLWFFPLLAFNQFTNFGRYSGLVHWLIASAPAFLFIAFSGVILGSFSLPELGVLIVYLMSFLSYSALLNLFSRYRESYAAGIARAEEEARSSAELRESEARFRRMFDETGTASAASTAMAASNGRTTPSSDTPAKALRPRVLRSSRCCTRRSFRMAGCRGIGPARRATRCPRSRNGLRRRLGRNSLRGSIWSMHPLAGRRRKPCSLSARM